MPVMFKDILEIVPAKETQLQLSGLKPGGNLQDNLVWKAYQLMEQSFPGRIPTLSVFLHKAIPMGAGLGGGSADGAFMLKLINDYCSLGLDQATLAEMALQLGSDCPFFIYNSPCLATGRGEVMTPMTIDLSAFSLYIICPMVHVSTRDAFSTIVPKAAGFDLHELPGLPVEQWKDRVTNDFEGPVFGRHSVLGEIKEILYRKGAIYASMSGSGSAIFGIFPKGDRIKIEPGIGFKEVFVETI